MNNTKKKDDSIGENNTIEHVEAEKDPRPVCGLIMPIADTDGYPAGHWKEVRNLLISVAENAGFKARIVSESDDVRVIQATIVQNVYEDDIIICDVSSKNPNVMFELGLRLAFDKATVIVKDYDTGYSFDTSPVEHINYPKDLRYYDIEKFKVELQAKLLATYSESKKANHSMYLQSFGKFVVKSVQTTEVSNDDYIIESLKDIRSELKEIRAKDIKSFNTPSYLLKKASQRDITFDDILFDSYQEYIRSSKLEDIYNPSLFHKFLQDREDILPIKIPTIEYLHAFIRDRNL